MDYKKIIKSRELRLQLTRLLRFVPSKFYIKMVYRMKTGRKLNLKHPKTINEKMQWLKFHDIHPEYTDLADKIKVREYIRQKLGDGYMFPLLGQWESFDDIDFSKLPDSFVLKCNHDSGSVKLIEDKNALTEKDLKELKKFFHARLRLNPFYAGREYPYKDIKPYIIAEKLMESEDGKGIKDYKFFCFHGEPKIMFLATERLIDVKFDLYDMDFNHLDIEYIHPNSDQRPEKPETFEEMKRIAATLSEGMKFVRIDLYEIDGKVYFGEFTFYSGGGFYLFSPDEWEQKLGDWVDLEN